MDDFQHLDNHALLGVAHGASPDEIKQAYRREITKYHPDRYRHADPQTQQYARERSQRLTEAYAALSRNKGQRLGSVSRSQFEGAATSRRSDPFAQPTSAAQLAGWYEQASALLAAGRADEALRPLRQIQRVDPFYRDVDALLAQAEGMEAAQRSSAHGGQRRRLLVWTGAGMLGLLLLLAGGWGAGVFEGTPAAQTTPGPAALVAEASPAEASGRASSSAASPPAAPSSAAPIAMASEPARTEEGVVSPTNAPAAEPVPSGSVPPTEVIPTSETVPPTEQVPTPAPAPPTEAVPTATAAIVAQAPRATQPPAAARRAVAVESGRVLVADNFNNPSSGWANLQTGAYTLGYRDGAYAITTEPGAGAIFSFGAPLAQGNVVIGADVTPIRGSAGLLFGPDNSYRFFITGDGRYRVDQRGKAVVAATASKALRRGTNRLVVAAVGKRASLYANGVLLTNLDLPSSLEGTTYGFVVSGGGSRGEGQFDTLTVRSLPR